MGRWLPDSALRLEAAALDRFAEHGFEQTTVAEIAADAGLTERTFYRYFADKREVLFGGAPALQELMVDAVASAPPDSAPLDAVAAALDAAGHLLQGRADHARRRAAVIAGNVELLERELIKLTTLAGALATALRARGVPATRAALAGEAGIAAFRIAFEQWAGRRRGPDLPTEIGRALADLRTVAAG